MFSILHNPTLFPPLADPIDPAPEPPPDTVTLSADPLAPAQAPATTAPADTSTTVIHTTQPNHLVINISLDTSITGSVDPQATLYQAAITTAVNFFQNLITNPITVNIAFGWGEVAGQTLPHGSLGASSTNIGAFSYAQLRTAVLATDTTSAVQLAAAASLPATDPTPGASFEIARAEQKALGLHGASGVNDGSVGLDSSSSFTFSGSIAGGTFDGVATIQHEISEVLGRIASGGSGGVYNPLDMFRYTATLAREEPFASGYNANTQSFFSFNGTTITNAFGTPAEVAAGDDVADWAASVGADAFGFAFPGQTNPLTTIDKQVMNVLGYDLTCYAAGTRIATVWGEAPVETLAIGDRVLTADGRQVPIIRISRRTVDGRHHPRPHDVWPVRVHKHAFAADQPHRDLVLSPDHGVFVNDAIIPIRYLLNGATIVQEPAGIITYHHVELPAHDRLLAEGLPAESFLDTTGDPETALKIWQTQACARLVASGPELQAARARLLARATALGHATTRDPDLRLRAGGRVLFPSRRGDFYRFLLPPRTRTVRLLSRTAVPAQTQTEDADHRRLGVAVARIAHNGNPLTLTDPSHGTGWYDAEDDPSTGPLRWTDGNAGLLLTGGGRLDVDLSVTPVFWQAPPSSR